MEILSVKVKYAKEVESMEADEGVKVAEEVGSVEVEQVLEVAEVESVVFLKKRKLEHVKLLGLISDPIL